MELALGAYARAGNAQNLYLLKCEPHQERAALAALQTAAKIAGVEAVREVVDVHTASAVQWTALARRNVWVVLRVPPRTPAYSAPAALREAAVCILCARPFECHANFKAWVLCEPADASRLPRVVLHMTGPGGLNAEWRAFSASDGETESGLMEPSESYEHCENATGALAQLQEDVFNSVPSITSVVFDRSYGSGAQFVRILRDALKFNIVVRTLDLSRSFGGDIIGRCLTSVLHTSRKLQRIILHECSLNDVGLATLAVALRRSPVVRELVLSRNPGIGDIGLHALALALDSTGGSQSRLRRLVLDHNNSLYTAEKQWSSSVLAVLWRALANAPALASVSLADCGLLPGDARAAARLWLSQAPQLRTLSLRDNAIGDTAVACVLDSLLQVETLDLSHTGMSSAGFRCVGVALSRRTTLASLALDTNNAMLLRDVDLAELREPLRPLSPLLRTASDVDAVVAAAWAGTSALPSGLTSPTFAGSPKTVAAVAAVSTQAEPVRAEAAATVGTTTAAADETAESPSPRQSAKSDEPLTPAEHVAAGHLSPEMTEALSETEGTSMMAMANALKGNTSLMSLSLARVNIGDAAVARICDLLVAGDSALTSLDLTGNCNMEEPASHKLRELLTGGFYADSPVVGNAGPVPGEENAPDAAKNALVASVRGTTAIASFGCAGAAAATTATPATRMLAPDPHGGPGSSMGASGTGSVFSFESEIRGGELRILHLGGNATCIGERALVAMYSNTSLTDLDVSDMALVDAMLLPLSEGILTNPLMALRSLRAGRNFFFYYGAVSIATFARHSTCLQKIDLSNTWASFTDEAGRSSRLSKTRDGGLWYMSPFLKMLAVVPSPPLTSLDLSQNDVNDAVGEAFAKALAGNTVMQTLYLLRNPLLSAATVACEPRIVTVESGDGLTARQSVLLLE